MHPKVKRHANILQRRITCGTLNIRSLNNKVEAVKGVRLESGLDNICLTETWHDDYDAVPIKRWHSEGLQVLERARPISANGRNYTINEVAVVDHQIGENNVYP